MTKRDFRFMAPEGLLAHYTSAAVVFEHVLPSGKLRISPYRDMRDPAENQDLVPSLGWFGEQPNADRAYTDLVRQLKFVRDSVRVLSFTRDSQGPSTETFGCSWARPRMWEQYGGVHRGACLVFDRERLEAVLTEQFLRQPAPYYMREVSYTEAGIEDSTPVRSISDDRIFDDKLRSAALMQHIDSHHDAFFFLKSNDFATEHEYRAVLMQPEDKSYGFVEYGDALVAVILGLHVPACQVPGARDACDAVGIELRQMFWHRGRPLALAPKLPDVPAV